MTKINPVLVNRLKSFAWRSGGMLLVASLNFAIENAGLIGLSPFVVVLLGLALGEVTKFLNS